MTLFAIVFLLLNAAAILNLPRRWAPLPLLLGACYMTAAQSLNLFAPLTAGLIISNYSGQWAMLSFATALGLAALVALTSRGLRQGSQLPAPRR